MTVLVLGAAGQLGQAMVARLSGGHSVTPATRRDVDVTDHRRLRHFVLDHHPEVVINCAAFNNVDAAEDEQERALDVNAFVVRTLARATLDLGAVIVHFGSDFVFSGTTTTPYTEDDAPNPQSVYAQSKLLGEWFAADNPRHYLLRVESLFGGPHTRSSIDRIAEAVRAGRQARVFFDRYVSPTFVDDLVEASTYMLERQVPFGLYHCVNTGVATWLEVGREVARLLHQHDSTLEPVSVNDVALRAPRPRYAALSNAKLAAAGFEMPSWQDALGRYLERTPAEGRDRRPCRTP